MQSMHHVIFLATDLRDHVRFIAKALKRDDVRHPLALFGGHEQIRQRFEDICGGHTYQWIANDSLEKLHALRGSIYGICLALSEAERHARELGVKVVPHVPETEPFDILVSDLEAFIQAVLRDRKEIDYSK